MAGAEDVAEWEGLMLGLDSHQVMWQAEGTSDVGAWAQASQNSK